MIYAIFGAYFTCAIVALLVLLVVFVTKMQLVAQKKLLDEFNTGLQALRVDVQAYLQRLAACEARPEAPAIEAYKNVLMEMEKQGSALRTIELKFGELRESVTRTQNKIAARETAAAKKELPAAPEAPVAPTLPFDNQLPFQPQQQPPPPQRTRRFGSLT